MTQLKFLNNSFGHVRAKLYGKKLSKQQFDCIIQDIVAGAYSDIQLSAFLCACVGPKLDKEEIIFLTEAMIEVGEKINWNNGAVYDKHCIGGLPANRTSPVVVAICSSDGLLMPKTSSKAITSPAGTADTLSVITHVNLSLEALKKVVHQENACLAWGGSIDLSPADDILIRVEKALDLDSEGQMVASILSKKAAAGSTHVLLDIPVGPSAKVRSLEMAEKLKFHLENTAQAIGLTAKVLITDGSQPIGNGIGPALEAQDVLSVLENKPEAPKDLKEKSIFLAAHIFEMANKGSFKECEKLARQILEEGKAWEKFKAICEAQGGMKPIPRACYQKEILAKRDGTLSCFNNRKLAKLAKIAGAPEAQSAGIYLHKKLGHKIQTGDILCTIHSQTQNEVTNAIRYANEEEDVFEIA